VEVNVCDIKESDEIVEASHIKVSEKCVEASMCEKQRIQSSPHKISDLALDYVKKKKKKHVA
jgi:hypothetical protein